MEFVRRGLLPDGTAGLRVLGENAEVGDARDVVRRQLYSFLLANVTFAHHLTLTEAELWMGAGGVAEHTGVGVDGEQRSFARLGAPGLADQIVYALA